MYGWNGFFATLTTYRSTVHLILTVLASLATLSITIYSLRGRWQPSSVSFPLAVGMMAVGSLLINPHVYLQDTVLIGVAVVLGLVGWSGRPGLTAIWLVIATFASLLVSRTMEIQDDWNLNLVTPLAAAIFLLLATGVIKQHAFTATKVAPRNVMYETRDTSQVEQRMAS
jgi:hypothetical protein